MAGLLELSSLQEVLRDECNLLSNLASLTSDSPVGWGAEPGYTGADLKNDTMHGCHTQRAFMEMLVPARRPPWSLAKE